MAPTLDDIAGLRRGRGVTMISSKFPQKDTSCKRLSSKHCTGPQSIIHTHNMTTVAMGNTTTSLTDQLSANITDKLPSCSVDTLSCRESPCYSNWQNGGSSLRLLIRERLSSPKCRSRAPLMSIPRLSSSIISLLCIILCASSTLGSEAPLSKTDATKMSQFRTFNGRGMYSDYSSGPDRNYLGGEAVMMRSIAPQKVSEATVLNFQTLRSIKKWGNTKDILLVSGRDYVYMLNAAQFSNNGEIRYIERLRWVSDVKTQDRCLQMSKQKYECNNFIRVIELLVNGTLMVCGTNSYFPRCRYYTRQQFNATSSTMDSSFTREVTCEGLGDCQTPYNPTSSSANLYTKTDHGYQLFTAVIKDFMGKEPVLMRKQRYVYSMDNWLNDPSFIQLVEYGEKIYLFFRETATKEETGTGSPQTYARIAQVCKDDAGGTTLLKNQWTTFLKARLTCTIPGKEYFTFNNLTSVSNVTEIQGENGELIDVIFATFTTPWDWNLMPMSAVCVYSLRDSIEDLFSTGRFYGLQDFESKPQQMSPNMRSVGYPFESETVTKSIPLPDNQVPNPRPGSCHAAMSDKALYFAKNYPLMYDSVDPLYNDPVFVSSNGVRLTQIAVDDNAGNSDHLVLYLGTENGNLLRIRPRLDFMHTGPKSVLLEEISLVGEGVCGNQTSECGVQALHISRPTQNGNTRSSSSTQSSVFVAFTDRMAQLPLAACIQYSNSDCCSIDPDCGWLDQKCIARTSDNNLSLLPTKSLRTIPSNCQQLPKPGGDGDSENLSAAGLPLTVIALLGGFLLGILLTISIVYCKSIWGRSHRKHIINKSTNGRYHSDHDSHAEFENQVVHSKVGSDYFAMSSSRATPIERPSSLHEIHKTDAGYAPLTPQSIEEKSFPKNEISLLVGESKEAGRLCITESEIASDSIFNETSETVLLIEELKQPLSDIQQSSTNTEEENVLCMDGPISLTNFSDQFETPRTEKVPKLPPKANSFRKQKPEEKPHSSRNANTSNNNSNDVTAFPSLLSSSQDRDFGGKNDFRAEVIDNNHERETDVAAAKETFVPLRARSPPPNKPPPPLRSGIRKNATFSAAHGKPKPPVPPKTKAIMRSSSLRSAPGGFATSDLHHYSLGVSPLVAPSLPPLVSPTRSRPPSYKHNSASLRVNQRGLRAVQPPVVPGSDHSSDGLSESFA